MGGVDFLKMINGTKMWITNGTLDGSTTGDVFLVYAKTVRTNCLFAQNVSIKWYLRSQFTHKPVNSISLFLVIK